MNSRKKQSTGIKKQNVIMHSLIDTYKKGVSNNPIAKVSNIHQGAYRRDKNLSTTWGNWCDAWKLKK